MIDGEEVVVRCEKEEDVCRSRIVHGQMCEFVAFRSGT